MRQYTTWRYGITGRGEGRAVQERGNGGRGEGGDVGAIAMVGQCYFRGSDGFKKVHTKALEWWERAGEGGNADACVSAGAVHYNGAGGIKVDRRKAFEWYQKGGELGSEEGWRNVVECYVRGEGVEKCERSAKYIVDTIIKGK